MKKFEQLMEYRDNHPEWDIDLLMFIQGWDQAVRTIKRAIQQDKDIVIEDPEDGTDDGQTVKLVKKKK